MDKIILGERTIEMEPVKQVSSTIKDAGYDVDGRLLVIRFKDGAIHCYSPILPHAYRTLLEAESIGSYLYKNIVNNKLVNILKLEPK